ncbi:MAG: hypothetical protein KC912_16425 [Proteobacteria bacterium]|nr:hypothetical protein [Pseudomonadota bacterium]
MGGFIRLALLLGLVACGSSTPWESSDEDGLTHFTATETSKRNGRAEFVFDVEDQHHAFLFSADAVAPYGVFVSQLIDPNGEVVFDARELADTTESLSGAQFADTLAHLNWPILAEHPALIPGTWTATVGPLDNAFNLTRGVDVEGALTLKSDTTQTEGVLAVRMVYANGADEDAELVRATEAAADLWVELYASHGIELELSWDVFDGAINDSTGGQDGELYRALAAESSLATLNLVVLPDFANWTGVFGLSGGIPGPLVDTPRSAVAVSGLVNAGPDMVFTDAEIQLYAETMAHEVGHYLGAYHPVEQNWSDYDAVSDTEACTTESDCLTAFRSNLMFPYPVCGPQNCTPQIQLTAGQKAVLQHYTAVR